METNSPKPYQITTENNPANFVGLDRINRKIIYAQPHYIQNILEKFSVAEDPPSYPMVEEFLTSVPEDFSPNLLSALSETISEGNTIYLILSFSATR
jgi:hypothetical protein